MKLASNSQRSTCLHHLAGIHGMCHHTWHPSAIFKCWCSLASTYCQFLPLYIDSLGALSLPRDLIITVYECQISSLPCFVHSYVFMHLLPWHCEISILKRILVQTWFSFHQKASVFKPEFRVYFLLSSVLKLLICSSLMPSPLLNIAV